MDTENLKLAASINKQVEAIRSARIVIKKLNGVDEDAATSEHFDLVEKGTGIDIGLAPCDAMEDILSAIDVVLLEKCERLLKTAEKL